LLAIPEDAYSSEPYRAPLFRQYSRAPASQISPVTDYKVALSVVVAEKSPGSFAPVSDTRVYAADFGKGMGFGKVGHGQAVLGSRGSIGVT